jgi:GntR family transcriptional regulator
VQTSYSKVSATRARLLQLIEGLGPGTALPSERDLAREWHVARMTLRRATDELVMAGLVTREQGRGTFVVQPKMAQPMAMTSFSDGMRERGIRPSSRVVDFRRLRGGGFQARALRIPATDPIIRFTRLRLADGEPIGLETTWVAASRVPGLQQGDLTESWYQLLADRYDAHILTGTSVIEIALATERDAKLLDCPPGAALFRIETTSYGQTGRVVDFGVDLFRGDRYSLMTERMPGLAVRAVARRPRLPAAASAAAPA